MYSSDNRMLLFTIATDFPQNVLDEHFSLGHTNVKVKIYSSYYCVKWDILRPGCIELSQESQQHFPPSINRKQKQSPTTTIALLMKIVSLHLWHSQSFPLNKSNINDCTSSIINICCR